MKIDPLAFSVTYQTVTPESAEHGDFEDRGFEHDLITFDTFEELVDYMESNGFNNPSSSPIESLGIHDWLSTEMETDDFETGEKKSLSLHPKNDRAARYMTLAAKHLGFI